MHIVMTEENIEAYLSEFFNGIEGLHITSRGVEFEANSKNTVTPRDQYIAEINELNKALISMSGSISFAHEVIAGAIQGYGIEEADEEEDEEDE